MKRQPVNANGDRKRQLGKIHQAKKQLNLDEDTYRALLVRVTGKSSSALMDFAERNKVIAEFARVGFKESKAVDRKRVFAGCPKNVKDVPLLRRCEALLANGKLPWSYAHSMATKMFEVKRVEWLREDQLHKLVSALQVDANRKSKK